LLKPICHAAREAASTGYAAIARFLIDERYFAQINHTWGRFWLNGKYSVIPD